MIIQRRFSKRMLAAVALIPMSFASAWALFIYVLYQYVGLEFLKLPFLPIATIGTAVAFYVGFKNNAAYDRFWEGRKIWGGIVNESRTWTSQVLAYVLPADGSDEAIEVRRRFVYRHLAYINALRLQLRKNSRFFDHPAKRTAQRLADHAEHMRNDWDKEISPFLSQEEHAEFKDLVNPATHMLNRQSQELKDLLIGRRIDLFHQIDMMGVVRELYALQGKCERIKATPFPRQYAEFSRWFTRAFILLVPCGLLTIFPENVQAAGSGEFWKLLPMIVSSSLITWVFVTMEGIGDASEDPFERSMNDVPMNALCRVIERDLRQLLGETEIPDVEAPAGMVLY